MKKFLLLVLAFALIALPMVMAVDLTGRVEGGDIPEFTAIGAGIAVIGAGIAYSLIKKKK